MKTPDAYVSGSSAKYFTCGLSKVYFLTWGVILPKQLMIRERQMTENLTANEKAIKAAGSTEALNSFLTEEKQHILRLTGKILNRKITESDDEFSIALMAVSEAVKNYDKDRGDFWSFASHVIKNRETDYYRKTSRVSETEMQVAPEVFSGEQSEDERDGALVRTISEKTAVTVDTGVRDEIESLSRKLGDFGISFFDLAECSPKAQKSKAACGLVLKAIFSPPPLLGEILKNRSLPINKILDRQKVSRKLIDRHRKYLISAALIVSGDYPEIAEYIPFSKEMKQMTGEEI